MLKVDDVYADTPLVESDAEQHTGSVNEQRVEGQQAGRHSHQAGEREVLDELALHPDTDGLYESAAPERVRGDRGESLASVYLR